ncbi:GNAT family N-acetyltransferase [Clostridium formicaceticum]|uniref:N-acetyltransferase domain-containing protein n=1 Tax=Clostridium formicaceticum TaxID=1497 RepID=A0AAC9RIN7_9CLOT|nr:GNAT family N-acetyltransferase [Clostridium formicaceticum]AOY77250.1 hypothetical protein BJL90_16170 [Clostridium formicaceticum]ARE87784.1 hypothetical protein CLFO_21840 [Clostridium formicaceticum]
MITIRKATKEDILVLSNTYKGQFVFEDIPNVEEYIIALDGNVPLGFSKIKFYDKDLVEIAAIYINPEERGQRLGDGIFRAALNYAEKQGYLWGVIQDAKKQGLFNFLRKEGLRLLSETDVPKNLQTYLWKYDLESSFFCDIPLFFKQGCENKKII